MRIASQLPLDQAMKCTLQWRPFVSDWFQEIHLQKSRCLLSQFDEDRTLPFARKNRQSKTALHCPEQWILLQKRCKTSGFNKTSFSDWINMTIAWQSHAMRYHRVVLKNIRFGKLDFHLQHDDCSNSNSSSQWPHTQPSVQRHSIISYSAATIRCCAVNHSFFALLLGQKHLYKSRLGSIPMVCSRKHWPSYIHRYWSFFRYSFLELVLLSCLGLLNHRYCSCLA